MFNIYFKTIEADLKKQDSQFELVFEKLCQYYREVLVTFTNATAVLVVHILILFRQSTKIPRSIYFTKMFPVSVNADMCLGKSHEYIL